MDSTDQTIRYSAIQKRAMEDAKEYAPDFPKENTVEAWEAFIDEVEAMDSFDIAHESCEWDWVIYYNRAMELCLAVPSDVLSDAEDQWHYMGAYVDSQFGLHSFACTLAAIIVTQAIAEAVDELKEELLELANNQLDNMET